jgi:N-acetylmuramoyl-L-alanine amidase
MENKVPGVIGTTASVNSQSGGAGGGSFRAAGTLGVNVGGPTVTGPPFATGTRSNDPAAVAIETWAANYTRGAAPPSPDLYPGAIPYLSLGTAAAPMLRLENRNLGNRLSEVRGLAIHCTGGSNTRNAFTMARFGCVPGWNAALRNNGIATSAHFAIAGNGDVVQFIPTSHSAFAQGPGDPYWISVEIDNPGRDPPDAVKATRDQIDSAQKLFTWLCRRFSIRPEVAVGHLCAEHWRAAGGSLYQVAKEYDAMTSWVCAAGSMSTNYSTDPATARNSRGLSCHRWLQPYVKPCPGVGLLSQLAEIAEGAGRAIRS